MTRIFSTLIFGFSVLAFSLPVTASDGIGFERSTAEVFSAKKKCKQGYVYNPDTRKCHPRGSH